MSSASSIFVTGGTGSLGKQLIETLLKLHFELLRIVVFSRDELKQYEMAKAFPRERYPALEFVVGDVRDATAVREAMAGIDLVVHAAALKHVPIAESNPLEAIKTNVMGAQNVIDAALACGVKRVIALSTDKAVAPTNLYGATKLCSDKLFIAADARRSASATRFSIVRYGNVLGSRGSVVPFFLEKRRSGMLPITDPRMTRFSIALSEATDLILLALERMWGGEIFIPKIPSYRIIDLAEALGPNCMRTIVGVRPGEKLHEELIIETDGLSTLEFDRHFVIVPPNPRWDVDAYRSHFAGKNCPPDFRYSSDENECWLDVEEIRTLCRRHIDPQLVF